VEGGGPRKKIYWWRHHSPITATATTLEVTRGVGERVKGGRVGVSAGTGGEPENYQGMCMINQAAQHSEYWPAMWQVGVYQAYLNPCRALL